jgi:hypothetical protein
MNMYIRFTYNYVHAHMMHTSIKYVHVHYKPLSLVHKTLQDLVAARSQGIEISSIPSNVACISPQDPVYQRVHKMAEYLYLNRIS